MKTILLALCGFFILGIDAKLFSNDESGVTIDPRCAKGPKYWCENFKNVYLEDEPVFSEQEKQSFQLPRDVLLLSPEQIATQVNQKKGNEFCTLCEYFLHFVQDALAAPANEDEIRKVVLTTCDKLRKDFQGQCHSFVDTYIDELVALLVQTIDPSQICPKLNVCVRTAPTANEKCPLCLFVIQDLEEQIQRNKSKENIENKLRTLRSRLKDDLKAECDDFIETYTPELVDKLANDCSPRDICLYLKLCTEKEEMLIEHIGDKASQNDYLTNTVYEIDSVGAPDCLICEQLVKEVEKKVAKDKSKEHIKKVLEEACSTLPKQKLKQKCLAAIEKETDYIVDLIIKEVTPKEVCIAIGFCIGVDIVSIDSQVKPKPNEYTCRLCQIVVQKIEDELNNKTAQQDIENCKTFVEEYANEVIKHFPSESPKALCTKACACIADDEEIEEIDALISDDEFSSPECVLCEQLVREVENKVKNDKSREHIKEVLEQACSSFKRQQLKEKCIEVVDKNADYIVDSIIKNLTPKEICHGLGFCDSKSDEFDTKIEEVSTQIMQKYSETPQCVLCELVMNKLEASLKKQSTQDEIETAVWNVCKSLPAKFSVKCKKFLDDYADLIISLVASMPPKELYGELNFCRSNLTSDSPRRDVLECGVCNSAVDALSIVLEKNGPKEHKIVTETTCHLLPARYFQQCTDLMQIYGISMTNLIHRSDKRSDICMEIGKCFQDGDNSIFVEINQGISPPKTKKLLGDSKCTYGPGY